MNALMVWHVAVPPAPVRAALNIVPTVLGAVPFGAGTASVANDVKAVSRGV